MSVPAINWAIEQNTLPPAQWVVLFHLAHCHNPEHGCFPSQDFLAEATNMSRRTLVRHLAALEEGGYIARKHRQNDRGTRISDFYILGFEVGFDTIRAGLSANLSRDNPCTKSTKIGTKRARNGTQTVSNSNRTVNPPLIPPEPDRFEEAWKLFPKRVAKGRARAAWVKALKKADQQTIIDGIAAYAAVRQGQPDQYTAHPATWLNGEGWDDEIAHHSRQQTTDDELNSLMAPQLRIAQ